MIRQLQRELETVLGPLRKEFLVRQGQFREFLKKTMPERIGSLVIRAKDSANRRAVAGIDRRRQHAQRAAGGGLAGGNIRLCCGGLGF